MTSEMSADLMSTLDFIARCESGDYHGCGRVEPRHIEAADLAALTAAGLVEVSGRYVVLTLDGCDKVDELRRQAAA